jgi:hypothetical protein
MAATNFTPISLYYSTTAAAIPSAGNLVAGELALNTVDEKLYFKNSAGTVKLLASNATSAPVLSFQTSLSGLTPSTATTGVVTLAGTLGVASGGTGLTTLTAGSLPYGAGTSAFSALAIGTAGQILTSSGTAPQWTTLTSVSVTTFSAGTTGFTPSSATSGAITLAGTLATTNGGTGLTSFTSGGAVYATSTSVLTTGTLPTTAGGTALTSFTANGVVYASSTSALATGSALTFSGTALAVNSTSPGVGINDTTATVGVSYSWLNGGAVFGYGQIGLRDNTNTQTAYSYAAGASGYHNWYQNGTEGMRLTSTGLGIGTSSPTSGLQTAGSSSKSAFKTPNIAEVDTISATAATGTIQYDVTTQSVLYYTSNASGNFTVNFRGSSGTSLNTVMQTGESISATFLVTNGTTAYYNSAVTIDGTSVTPKWQGGTAPTSGNASSVDCYTYVIQKTGSATYVVLASQTKFA